MKCPYCNNEMEKGVLQSGQIILWAKKKHHLSLNAKDGEVELGRNYMGGCALTAYICKSCKKVLVDYEENED